MGQLECLRSEELKTAEVIKMRVCGCDRISEEAAYNLTITHIHVNNWTASKLKYVPYRCMCHNVRQKQTHNERYV